MHKGSIAVRAAHTALGACRTTVAPAPDNRDVVALEIDGTAVHAPAATVLAIGKMKSPRGPHLVVNGTAGCLAFGRSGGGATEESAIREG
jgi:hypothetical protein